MDQGKATRINRTGKILLRICLIVFLLKESALSAPPPMAPYPNHTLTIHHSDLLKTLEELGIPSNLIDEKLKQTKCVTIHPVFAKSVCANPVCASQVCSTRVCGEPCAPDKLEPKGETLAPKIKITPEESSKTHFSPGIDDHPLKSIPEDKLPDDHIPTLDPNPGTNSESSPQPNLEPSLEPSSEPIPELLPRSSPQILPQTSLEILPQNLPEIIPSQPVQPIQPIQPLQPVQPVQPVQPFMPQQIPQPIPQSVNPNFPPRVPQPVQQFMPQPIPQAFPRNIPQNFPRPRPQAFPQTMSQSFPQPRPQAFPQNIPQSFPQRFPQAMPQRLPQQMPQPMPQPFPQALSQGFPRPIASPFIPQMTPRPTRLPAGSSVPLTQPQAMPFAQPVGGIAGDVPLTPSRPSARGGSSIAPKVLLKNRKRLPSITKPLALKPDAVEPAAYVQRDLPEVLALPTTARTPKEAEERIKKLVRTSGNFDLGNPKVKMAKADVPTPIKPRPYGIFPTNSPFYLPENPPEALAPIALKITEHLKKRPPIHEPEEMITEDLSIKDAKEQ